jgi:hypothetical protein
VLPSSETVVQEGDLVYAAALSHEIQQVADMAAAEPAKEGA